MLLLTLLIIGSAISFGFMLTGALLSALFWACVKLPLGIVLTVLGFALCCTLILLPVGWKLIKYGIRLIVPGI